MISVFREQVPQKFVHVLHNNCMRALIAREQVYTKVSQYLTACGEKIFKNCFHMVDVHEIN